LRLQDVIVDRQRFKCRQRPDDDVYLVALDQFLRLGPGPHRIAAGVGDEELDLAPGDDVVALLEKQLDAFLHLPPARGERARAHGEKTQADRLILRVCRG